MQAESVSCTDCSFEAEDKDKLEHHIKTKHNKQVAAGIDYLCDNCKFTSKTE